MPAPVTSDARLARTHTPRHSADPVAGRHRAKHTAYRARPDHRDHKVRRYATLAAATAVAATSFGIAAHATTSQATRVAYDTMTRTVTGGLGRAQVGGAYTATPARLAQVGSGVATIRGIQPGHSFVAGLPAVSAANLSLRATFSVTTLPTTGRGVYLRLDVRKQKDGRTYQAVARVAPRGALYLSFTESLNGGQLFLTNEKLLPLRVSAGKRFVVQALVTGTTAVALHERVWPAGAAAPSAWQLGTLDQKSTRIATAGAIGFEAYISRTSQVATAHVDDLIAQQQGSTTPTPTPSATSSAPSATSTATPTPSDTTTAPSVVTTSPSPTATSTPPTTSPDADAGSAPVGSTAYAIPAGAIVVSPSGSDSAAGTATAPVRTLARAIAISGNGSTIVMRGGTYHERVDVPSTKTLTIQPHPHEAVWLDGSSTVGSWTQQGSHWVHAGWTAQFDSTAGYTTATATNTAPGWQWLNPAYPMAAHPDQVFVNDSPLRQVASESLVVAGTFYADYAGHRLVIGDNPAGKEVHASDLEIAMTIHSNNTTLRGIGVRRYATTVPDMATVRFVASGAHIQNVVMDRSATEGIGIFGTGARLSHVTVQDSGLLGILGTMADDFRADHLLLRNNNAEHFNFSPVSGGIKFSRTRGISITDSVVDANIGVGIWLDESSYDATILHNKITSNRGHGLSFEISATATISDNIVTGNGADGFKINDSTHVKIWNNTLGRNGRDVELVQDTRRASDLSIPGHDRRQPLPDPTETWILGDVQLMNNTFGQGGAGQYQLYARDYSGEWSAKAMGLAVDGNVFTRPSSSSQAEIVWGISASTVAVYTAVGQFATATGYTRNGEATVGSPPVIRSPSTPSGADPLALPADVAAAIGQPTGAHHLGSFIGP